MDDVRLPEFEVDDDVDARTHSRRSAQSGRVEFITRGDRRRIWADQRHHRRFDLTGFARPVLALAVVGQAVAGRSASLFARQFQGIERLPIGADARIAETASFGSRFGLCLEFGFGRILRKA